MLFWHTGNAQIVPSSCTAPQTIIEKYKADADRLALGKIYARNLSFIDSIKIPKAYSDTFLNALIAVYNATSLPARDTVVSLLDIHSWPTIELNSIYISADSNLSWMQQLRLGNIPTGNSSIDSLISAYHFFTIEKYSDWDGILNYHTVTLESDSNYNMRALAEIFEAHPDIIIAEPATTVGDGDHIENGYLHSLFPPNDHIQLIFVAGWNDCYSGCVDQRRWRFNIYFNCSVEYVGSTGSALVASIDGHIQTEMGAGVPGVNVLLTGDETDSMTTFTNGSYYFEVRLGGSYTITPSKSNDVVTNNGITSVDVLLTRRHILGIAPLGSPYKIIAAAECNAAGDTLVSTADILLTRQLILGSANSYPTNRLWQFIPSDYVFPDATNPFPFPTTRTYTNITTNQTGQDFIGIKLGDVNGSWDANTP